MSIFRSISPLKPSGAIDQTNLLAVLRDRIFQYIIMIFAFLAICVAAAVTIISFTNRQITSIFVAWALVLVIIATASFRKVPHRIRVFIFAAILFIAASYLLLSSGFSTHGLLLMMGFVITVTLFNGVGDGIISGIIALGAIYAAGTVITSGTFSLPAVIQTTNSGFEWLIGGVSFFALASISIGAISVTLTTLQNTIADQTSEITSLSKDKAAIASFASDKENELSRHNLHIDLQVQVSHLGNLQKGPVQYLFDISNLLEKTFSLYHVGIYLLDESGENLFLQAATGETGRILATQKFHLKVGKNSMIGYVAMNNEPRYAPNVSEDSTYYQNPMLPYTRSELSVPVSLNDKVIGVLDLHADKENAFTSSDIKSYQLLGAQIGASISTRDLATRLEKTQLETIKIGKANIRKSWRNHLLSTHRNYNFHLKEQKLETDSIPSQQAQTATQLETYVKETITQENGSQHTVLALPIKLRGQVIGVLDLHYSGKTIPEDLIQLLDATSNRLALALENARLLEELEMRAEREHLVGNISAKVRSSTAVQDILSTAASELGQTLGVSEVIVQLRSEE